MDATITVDPALLVKEIYCFYETEE